MKRNFILLVSLSDTNAAFGPPLLARIQRDIDATARPAWLDSKGAGIFMQSNLPAREIWRAALPPGLPPEQRQHFRDAMLLEVGESNLAYPDTKSGAWLNSHRICQDPEAI